MLKNISRRIPPNSKVPKTLVQHAFRVCPKLNTANFRDIHRLNNSNLSNGLNINFNTLHFSINNTSQLRRYTIDNEKKEEKPEEKKDEKKDEKPEEKKEEKHEKTEDTKTKTKTEDKKKEGDKKTEKEEEFFDEQTVRNWMILGTFMVIYYFLNKYKDTPTAEERNKKHITMYQLFTNILQSEDLEYVEYDLSENIIYVYLKSTNNGPRNKYNADYIIRALSPESFEKKVLDAEAELGIPASESLNIKYTGQFDTKRIMSQVIVYGVFLGIFLLAYRSVLSGPMGRGSPFSVGKMDKATPQKSKVTFKQVAGMEEAKAEIMEFVHFLKRPKDFTKLGAKIPRGAILFGPPGTGKTLLAKAVAGESDVPFYSMAGSDFVEMFVGVGPARVRDLFAKARKAKTAIIYIDEIDAIGKPRGGQGFGGNDERENTLNQLLVEMDGMTSNDQIVVMASTNVQPEDLDSALLRPGRFDRQITIDKPTQEERVEIYKVHLKPIKAAPEVTESIERLAVLTPGFSGADISNVCNEAALIAARSDHDEVTMDDIEKAIERVIAGIERKSLPITQREKEVIAHHEAGHAIVAWFLKHCDPLLKISVVPRGKALGYAQYMPKERFIRTYDQLMDLLCQLLAGRVAEKIQYGHLSTGAKDDLQKVTQIAYGAVQVYGMSPEVGPVSFPTQGEMFQKPFSEATAKKIDTEVKKLIDIAFSRTEEILLRKRDLLEKVAAYLIKHEVMNTKQFEAIVGPRPFQSEHSDLLKEAIEPKETTQPDSSEQSTQSPEQPAQPDSPKETTEPDSK